MRHDWRSTVRGFLLPVQNEENPFDQIEKITTSYGTDVEKLTQAIEELEEALNHNEPLSFLAPGHHSEEMVRDFLHDLLESFRNVTPTKSDKEGSSTQQQPQPKNLLIAVDFDDTIVEHRYPEIGDPLPGAMETLRALQEAGHRLILFTCREDESDDSGRHYLSEAIDFCKKFGVKFVSANETLSSDDFRAQGGRKVYADIYIDDRNIGGFPGWEKIREILLGPKKSK